MKIIRKTIENDEEYLRQISQPVSLDDDNYKKEIELLERFCNENECFALAAVQIGIPKRMIYLKNTTLNVPLEDMNYNESKVLINPIVIYRKGCTKYWEACLSCLDNMGLVNRPYEMLVQYYDDNGIEHSKKFEGFEATVLSHELDHLDGILHMDIAEEILNMPLKERKVFREQHPYEIISKTCDYDNALIKRKTK
jgi:peptide deformylase